jgi:predicted solute-binding protein
MTKNIESKNTSTELFYDLAKRSFEASWKTMQDMCSDSISHLVDDADFMSAFIRLTINHVCHNFELLHKKEIKEYYRVNFEEVAERLVRNAWVFC